MTNTSERSEKTRHSTKRNFAAIAILMVVMLTEGVALGQTGSKNKQLPNVLIILVDDMGYGDPGCYNSKSKIPTPHIDSLAKKGMRFTDAHASGPLCHLSRYGLMTGQFPFRTKVGKWGKQPVIGKTQTTIASMLKSRGYQTAMVGKWHLGFKEEGYDKPLHGGPVDVGFDTFFGIRASTDIPPYFYIRNRKAVSPPTKPIAANRSKGWSPIQGAFWRAGKIAPDMQLSEVLPRFTEEAISVIKNHADKNVKAKEPSPLFLYLAYPAPHTPWLPSKEFVNKSKAGMYGDFTVMVDAMIGRVLTALKESKMQDNTLVIFSSDNGPVWYEKDVQKFGHDSSGGLRGMKADAWEGGHRMPFIVRWPGHVPANSKNAQTICFTDVFATLASITKYRLKAKEAPDSFDFSHLLQNHATKKSLARPPLVIRSGSGLMTVRDGDWKLIAGKGSGGFSRTKKDKSETPPPAGQLYNLRDDPAESSNLYRQRPEIVKRLLETLAEVRQSEQTRQKK